MEPLGKFLVAGRVADDAGVELNGPSHHRADVGNELVRHATDDSVERRFSAASARPFFVSSRAQPALGGAEGSAFCALRLRLRASLRQIGKQMSAALTPR